MLLRIAIIIVNYNIVHQHQIGWLLRALMFLSVSMLILTVQPYKITYNECVGQFIACSVGVSDTATCHIPVYPAISK